MDLYTRIYLYWIFISHIHAAVYAQAPVINIQPSDGYAAIDESHTLRCTSNAEEVRSQVHWYKDGQRFQTQYDNPRSVYVLTNGGNLFFLRFKTVDVGTYYCNITNSFGSTISRTATLQLPELTDEFRVSPVSTSAVLQDSVSLQCQPPRGTPEPQVQWMKNGTLLDVDSDSRLSIESPPGNLVISNVQRSDQAIYRCVASNEAGERTSNPATLTVLESPSFARLPIDLFVNEGEDARFPCVASGDPTPLITWKKKNDGLDRERSNVLQDNTLVITNVDPSDEGAYTCIASNEGGNEEVDAHLTVYTAPTFLQRPTSKTVGKGSDVIFRCVVTGNPPPYLSWSKTQDDLLLYARQTSGRYSVLEDGTLQISDSTPDDDGEYQCFASNVAGRNVADASLRVRDTADSRPPPIITEVPRNVTTGLNQNVELQCKASGNPSPTIRWTHNKRPVLDDARISINRGNLKITDVMVTDSGEYTCLAISGSGDASASAFLNVIGARDNKVETLLPPSPERPVASRDDITDRSVKLFWGASGDSSQNIVYSVDIFTLQNREGWVTAVESTSQTSAIINQLQPGSSYVMLVRAHNVYGTSEPSPVSDYITTTGGPSNPALAWSPSEITNNIASVRTNLLHVDVLSSTAVNVTWELLDSSHEKYVEGFYIRLSRPNGVALPVDNVYGSLTAYHIITNLQPYTSYTVSVTPFYHESSGRPSNLKSITTKQDVPSGPPSAVEVKEGPRYITVSWMPPKPSHRNGEIIGYVIVCNSEDVRLSRNFSVNATVMNVALDNLNRDTLYKIGVAARTVVGTGIISHMWPVAAVPSADAEDTTWWKHTVIGALGGLVWVVLCILIICLCRRHRAQKKAKKQTDGTITDMQPTMNRNPQSPDMNQHQQFQTSNFSGRPSNQSNGTDYGDQHNMDNYNDPQFKTFYNKTDSMSTGPYATTVILNNMPADRDESMMPRESPHATLNGNIAHGSCDSSCTDNNGATKGALSNSSGDRSSPPVLPSFADMLPPPPMYPPPPPTSTAADQPHDYRTSPRQGPQGTLPKVSAGHCHTCHRGYHQAPTLQSQQGRAHFMLDSQGRPYNPTMPHLHSFSNSHYNGGGDNEYHTTYPSMPRVDSLHSYQPYNVCHPHGHSSDSHDYAEPQFDCMDQSVYGQAPARLHSRAPASGNQMMPPPHLLHLYNVNSGQNQGAPKLAHQNSMPVHMQHQHASMPPQGFMPRHHSLPGSDHSHEHELCMSCAEHTEYDEPWTDQHWPMMWDQRAKTLQQIHQHQHPDASQEEIQTEETPMLQAGEEGSVASSADGNNTGGQSRSGSEDSKSGRQRQKRRQRAQQLPGRPSSPYNGYSTDSSVVFVPRKPYPKSQRKKQMNTKPKSTKSLAVQVEHEEVTHDKV